ncbi:MAG: hypothetical protein QW667_02080 [Candidatus Bathyarchaeia archaeon]
MEKANIKKKIKTRDLALTGCFAALYALLGIWPISPIIGLPGKAITAAAMIAPVMGMILGPYFGFLSTTVGGLIDFSQGFMSPPSLVSGVFAALCGGMLSWGKRGFCALTYVLLLSFFGFYPSVGPVWLYPPLMWFQILGLLLLISPVQAKASKNINPKNHGVVNHFYAFFITCLTSTLAGQIAGSLSYEIMAWPALIPELDAWKINWQALALVYPIERIVIAFGSAIIGLAISKILNAVKIA